MHVRSVFTVAALALTSITASGCVDDGYRRPGLVVVEERPVVRRDYRDYRRYDRYDRRHDRRYDDRYDRRPYY